MGRAVGRILDQHCLSPVGRRKCTFGVRNTTDDLPGAAANWIESSLSFLDRRVYDTSQR